MTDGIGLLCTTAASIAVVHTLLGPDHYLPFVAMSRAGQWSFARTIAVTLACGVGHVLSSALLGSVGVGLGLAVFRLERIEAVRGDLAGWLLLAFGLAYASWGVRRAVRSRPHEHWHAHSDGVVHKHPHVHVREHAHVHAARGRAGAPGSAKATPWILFTIFVFGPCEPLIPLLMVPAARGSAGHVALVAAVFALCTISTMTAIVMISLRAVRSMGFPALGRFGHAVAGVVLIACGVAIQVGL